MLKTVTKVEEVLECDATFKDGRKHGRVPYGEKTCPDCDRCEHGKGRKEHCVEGKCGDMSWQETPLTRQEFDIFIMDLKSNWYSYTRRSPHPRQYITLNLVPKIIAALDYDKMFGSR